MNKTFTIIFVLIIVVIGGFLLFFNKSNVPATDNATILSNTATNTVTPKINGIPVETGAKMETGTVNENKLVVTYTDSGFSPKTITIKKGDSITFVNQSSGDMWVASNPHPVHTDYPAFDEKASVQKGGSWSFTFGQAGTWGYHNHKNPSSSGTVVVE